MGVSLFSSRTSVTNSFCSNSMRVPFRNSVSRDVAEDTTFFISLASIAEPELACTIVVVPFYIFIWSLLSI
jgi:hypothetical protein